jgi:hypothetical protein
VTSPEHAYRHSSVRNHHQSEAIDRVSVPVEDSEEREAESATDAAAQGSVIEFDQFSVAGTIVEDSVELHSFSQSVSQSQQVQLQRATEQLLLTSQQPLAHKENPSSRYASTANTHHSHMHASGADPPASASASMAQHSSQLLTGDQQAVMAVLLQLAQSPAATLIATFFNS